jgi:sugar lactone lactonase YvrE
MSPDTNAPSTGRRRPLWPAFRESVAIVVSVLELALLVLALGPFDSSAQAQAPTQSPSPDVLLTLPEHDSYPENIASDPRSGDYFLRSMAHSRILRIHPDGSYEDFVSDLEPVLQTTVGMKVDPRRRYLWVCTGRCTLFDGTTEGAPRTGVLLFDLDRGTLLQSWLLDQPDLGHIFNDLALAADGDAYVTTTQF